MKKIRGLTFEYFAYTSFKESYYYGYDHQSHIVLEFDGMFTDQLDFIELPIKNIVHSVERFEEFIHVIIKDLAILDWKELYNDENTCDGSQWKLVIHFEYGGENTYIGVNAQPANFNHFLEVSKQYGLPFAKYFQDDEDEYNDEEILEK